MKKASFVTLLQHFSSRASLPSPNMEAPRQHSGARSPSTPSDQMPTVKPTDAHRQGKNAKHLAQLVPGIRPTGAQVAVLIDDGLVRPSAASCNIRAFAQQPASGHRGLRRLHAKRQRRLRQRCHRFTTDHAAVGKTLRLPFGKRGVSASPYFCLSDFVKHWPANAENQAVTQSRLQLTRPASF